jgi:hypothetical protein
LRRLREVAHHIAADEKLKDEEDQIDGVKRILVRVFELTEAGDDREGKREQSRLDDESHQIGVTLVDVAGKAEV